MDREKNIYDIGKTPEELQSALLTLRADFDAHNHDGSSSKSFETLRAETLSIRTLSIRKTSFSDVASGLWAGVVDGVMKFKIGDATSSFAWSGSALTVTGGTITGATIQTAAAGERIVLEGSTNEIRFYNDATKIAAIQPDVAGTSIGIEIQIYRSGTTEYGHIDMNTNATTGHTEIELRVSSSIDGIDIEYEDANGYATVDFNGRINSDFDPDAAATRDIGSSTLYWDVINYKTLTDRGCLGWYDDGIELQDGRVVSDIEAIESIRKHPTLKTPAGAARLDYKTMPKHIYQMADDRDEDGKRIILPRDHLDRPFKIGPKGKIMYAQDGAETTALISLMLGAIKELNKKIGNQNQLLKAHGII